VDAKLNFKKLRSPILAMTSVFAMGLTYAPISAYAAPNDSNVDLKLDLQVIPDSNNEICQSIYQSTNKLASGCPLVSNITITNNGSEVAHNVVMTAPQPIAWLNPVIVAPLIGCALDENEDLACTFSELNPGESRDIVIVGETDPALTNYSLSSVARVKSDENDMNYLDNTAATLLSINQESDLSIDVRSATDVASGVANVVPGENVVWTITATNNGPSTATNVRILESLNNAFDADLNTATLLMPAELTGLCRDIKDNHNTTRCKVDALPPGQSVTMVVDGRINSSLTRSDRQIQSFSGVSSDTFDPNDDNNLQETEVTLKPAASELSLGIYGPSSVHLGEQAVWNFSVENMGPSDANNSILTIEVPKDLTDVQATYDRGVCVVHPLLVTCDLGNLPASDDPNMPGNLFEGTISGTVSNNADSFVIFGSVNSDSGAGEESTDEHNVEINRNVDLSKIGDTADDQISDLEVSHFSITPNDDYDGPGSTRDLRFTVKNLGPNDAPYAWFRIGHERGVKDVLSDDMRDRCQETDLEIICTITESGLFKAGETMEINYPITIASNATPGHFRSYVNVYGQLDDSNRMNNVLFDNIEIGDRRTDLQIFVEPTNYVANYGSPGIPGSMENPKGTPSFIAGGEFRYTINLDVPEGDYSDAYKVEVNAEVPLGFTLNSAITSDGYCEIHHRGEESKKETFDCAIPQVSMGEPSSIIVSGLVAEDSNNLYNADAWADDIPFTVEATSRTLNLNGEETKIDDTTYVDVIESADLSIFATPDSSNYAGSEEFGVVLTSLNNGISDVEHAVLSFTVPTGFKLNEKLSTCVEPDDGSLFVDDNKSVDIVPLAVGDAKDLIYCKFGELNEAGEQTTHLSVGGTGNIHLVFDKSLDKVQDESIFDFTIGSLAYDSVLFNNSLMLRVLKDTFQPFN